MTQLQMASWNASVSVWQRNGGNSLRTGGSLANCANARICKRLWLTLDGDQAGAKIIPLLYLQCQAHTAPEWCQPDRLGTLSFSAFLVVCDQDKKPYVVQHILYGGNFCQLTSLLLQHKLSVTFTGSSENHCCPT